MKTPFIVVALAVVALTLAPASNPCQAGIAHVRIRGGDRGPTTLERSVRRSPFLSPPASANNNLDPQSSQLLIFSGLADH